MKYPLLFAGMSPWNGPSFDTANMMKADTNDNPREFLPELQATIDAFVNQGIELPAAFFFGDQDPGITLDNDLLLPILQEAYQGQPDLLQVTVMKNMPHGALPSEARATWDFLKHFRRLKGDKHISRL